MSRFIKKTSKMVGLPPGTPIHIGEKKIARAKITIVDYTEAQYQEKEAKTIEECFPFKDTPTITWINIVGVHQVEIIEKLGDHFSLHPLSLEDIMNTEQRPKMEDVGEYLLVALKMFSYDKKTNETREEQISLILGSRFVISFQEGEGDIFEPIKDRIRNNKGRIRKMGADYLVYALIDAIVDTYFIILEDIGEKIETVEEELITHPTSATLRVIHTIKRDMIFLRKSLWPMREIVSSLERGESALIHKSTGIYLRDVYDHTIQVIDTIETYRDMISGMLDIYLSSVSNAMNAIMKVLTIIATIFMPLTFIAGIYGMNFRYMPELEWRWGYYAVWSVMAVIGLSMLVYFKRKKWL